MKKVISRFIGLVFFLAISHVLYAQSPKELYGSFEAGCKVYNYHFKQDADMINSFTITELGNPEKRWDLKADRVKATISNLKILAELQSKPDTLNDEEWKAVDNLRMFYDVLQRVSVTEDSIRSAGTFKEKLKVFSSNKLNPDSIMRKALGAKLDSTGYTLNYIIKEITNVVNFYAGNELPDYLSFNDLKIEVFRGVFTKLIAKKEPGFDTACRYERNDLINRVFYEIKSRLGFLDDEPVTAYLKLRTNKLKVYLQDDHGITGRKLRTWDAKRRKLENNIEKLNDAVQKLKRTDSLNGRNDNKDNIELYSDKLAEQRKKLDTLKLKIIQRALNKGYAIPTFSNWNDRSMMMDVENVTAEFEDGTLKNLFVDLWFVKDSVKIPVRFRNNMPISVSSKFDPDAFENHIIFASTPCVLYRTVQGRGVTSVDQMQRQANVNMNNNCLDLYFVLSDLLDYLIVAQSEKEDFSPANEVYQVNPQNPSQQLKKELRSKILNVRFYSDLVGVKDDQPNGLVQIEASKRINLKTSRTQSGPQSNTGWFTYIEPKITIRKIEQNNKNLFLSNLDSVSLKEGDIRFTTDPLSLLQYANFSITTDLNIFRWSMARYKANWHFNIQPGFYRTSVADSAIADTSNIESKASNVNSGMFGAQVIYELKPDSRYGASFGLEFRYLHPFSDKYRIAHDMKRFVHTIWFEGFMKTGPLKSNDSDSRLFFRTRFNQLVGKWNRNFMQIQFGYAVNLFKRN